MNDFIELRRISTIILRRWWWLVIATGLAALLGYFISRQQAPVYQATTTILVGDSIKSSHVDRVDIQVSEALVATYVQLARRQPVLQGVITTLNLNQSWQALYKQVEVNQIEGTQLIEINVEANSPDMARTVADEIVNQLILFSPTNSESRENDVTNNFNREQIKNLQDRITNAQNKLVEIETAMGTSISEIQLADLQKEKTTLEELLVGWERNYTELLALTEAKRNPTQLSVIESAHSNNNKIRPRVQLNSILSGVIGLVLALGFIFILDFVDDTYKSLSDFSQSEEVTILGSIRKIKGRKLSDKVVAHTHPHSPTAESYRIIRSRIRFKGGDLATKSIMVTSSMPEEGRSVTAANLAVVFAQSNHKTVIVDANLRHPTLHNVFGLNNEVGLGDMLSSPEIGLEKCLRNTEVNNLQILTGGSPVLDPSERLGSERMAEIMMELRKIAEIVIFDTPPVLVFADAIVLSPRMDGVITVIQAGKSRRAAIGQTLSDLQNANAKLLGSIFNQSPKSDTFSVNKAYMQERPRLSVTGLSARKENVAKGGLHDLRDSAKQLHLDGPSAEVYGSQSEVGAEENEISVVAEPVVDFHDRTQQSPLAGPSDEVQELGSGVGVEEKKIATQAGTVDFHDSAAQLPLDGPSKETADLESEVSAEDKEIASQKDLEAGTRKRRRNRARKGKKNDPKSEETSTPQMNVSLEDQAEVPLDDQVDIPLGYKVDVPMHEAHTSVDQTISLTDHDQLNK